MAVNRPINQPTNHDLVIAAKQGNLKRVQDILSTSKIDINATANTNANYQGWELGDMTALSAAAANGKVEVVRELFSRGASVAPPSQTTFDYFSTGGWPTHALISYVLLNVSRDDNFRLLHLLLQQTKHLLPNFNEGTMAGTGMINVVCNVKPVVLPFIWLEAISRNETNTLKELILDGRGLPTIDEFKIFISNRDISVQLANNINNALSFLVSQKKLSNEAALEFKKLAESNITFLLEVDAFPTELREYLSKLGTTKGRSLQELFAAFRSLFCPEENLPRVPVDSGAFQNMDQTPYIDPESTKEESIKLIRANQNPNTLLNLLNLDQVNILIRLGACKEETGDNPTAALLAEILLFHHKEIPSFTQELQKKCLRILTKLYALTDFEKLLLLSHQSQGKKLNELQDQNVVLAAKLDDVQETINTLASQNEKILKLLLSRAASPDNEMKVESEPTTKRQSPGGFFS